MIRQETKSLVSQVSQFKIDYFEDWKPTKSSYKTSLIKETAIV